MTWSERVYRVISPLGVSLAEFIVLDEVRLRVPLPPKDMTRFCVKEVSHLPEVKFTAEDFAMAITSCVRKGWLESPSPQSSLRFTTEGEDLMNRIVGDIRRSRTM
jgi:hypothetical protein